MSTHVHTRSIDEESAKMYLDNASTTPVRREVIDAMMPYLESRWHNPSSLYSDATYVRAAVDRARKTVAELIGAKPSEIYFTSGGSESNCWAIQGFANSRLAKRRVPVVITTDIEHKSIIECVKNLPVAATYFLDVDVYGFVDLGEVERVIEECVNNGTDPRDILVSIQYANNEIGTVQDIHKIGDITSKYGCVLHTDAVQAFGQIGVSARVDGFDMMSASAHKIGGCKGTGVLYVKEGTNIDPLIYGSQMNSMRGGTENVAGIIGMAKAVELVYPDNDCKRDSRDRLIECLEDIGCKLNGPRFNRLPNNVNVILPYGVNAETLLYSLDVDDLQIGTGSACNSRSMKPSHVLKAIGLSDDEVSGSVRITIGDGFTEKDAERVGDTIDSSIKVLKNIEESE